MKKIILASKSPRRQELLKAIKLKFTVHPSDFEEKEHHENPEQLALHNAEGKARDIARHYKNALIIGVDTIGYHDGQILGKPKNREDHRRILEILSSSTHKVITGLCVIDTQDQKSYSTIETTLITMDNLSDKDIETYITSGEGEDKAAGYAIQGIGSLFVEKIEGDYFNVVGLPVFALRKLLNQLGFDHWYDKVR